MTATGEYRVTPGSATGRAAHYAVEVLDRRRRWRPVRYWPTAEGAEAHRAALEARRRRQKQRDAQRVLQLEQRTRSRPEGDKG